MNGKDRLSVKLEPLDDFPLVGTMVQVEFILVSIMICRAIDDSLKSIKVFFIWLYGGTCS